MEKNLVGKLCKVIFNLSQIYWLYWIAFAIYSYFSGIHVFNLFGADTGVISFGWEAVGEVAANMILTTCQSLFLIIPIYQVIYLLAIFLIRKKVEFRKKMDT